MLQKYVLTKKCYTKLQDRETKKQSGGNNFYDLTMLNDFEIMRNNSLLVGKDNEKRICTLNRDGNLSISLNNQYIKIIDGHTIDENISSMKHINYEVYKTKTNTFVNIFLS